MDNYIVEGNKKMAEFLGYKYYPYNHPQIDGKDIVPGWKSHPHASNILKMNPLNRLPRNSYLCRSHNGLIYNSDWNWLSRVLAKINKDGHIIQLVFSEGYNQAIINSSNTTEGPKTANRNGENPIMVVWNACLDHIEKKRYKYLE